MQEFSLGGESDSAYEYLIKEYVLLGGLETQYRKLYIDSVVAAEQNLFYRPLVEGDPDILFSGKFRSYYNDDGTQADGALVGEMSHLVIYFWKSCLTIDLFCRWNACIGLQNLESSKRYDTC